MKTGQIISSRLLPKTGQVTSYRAGDDGTYQAGWWEGLTIAGNRSRFISMTIDSDLVTIDLATGLMWAADANAWGCNNGAFTNFNDSIDFANALIFAGFNDWRLPNIMELLSICDWSKSMPAIDITYFPNSEDYYRYSSTTHVIETTKAYIVYLGNGDCAFDDKINSCQVRCVRGGV